jgi:hypothetical protein
MAARKKSKSLTTSALNKDLLVFIVILLIVATITYVLTYNAIMSRLDQYVIPTASQTLMAP